MHNNLLIDINNKIFYITDTMFKIITYILLILNIAGCGKYPHDSDQREVSTPFRDVAPSEPHAVIGQQSNTHTSTDSNPEHESIHAHPIGTSPTNPEPTNRESNTTLDIAIGVGSETFAKPSQEISAWPSERQNQINVAIIGDSISQGSFAETSLGEPFPLRYAQFYDKHLHLLAWLKFAPSIDARTTLGHIMGRVFKDVWLPHSFVGNKEWGILPQMQQLYPWANIEIHSQALMASTSFSIESQLTQLLDKKITYDYFLIAIGANDVCSSDVIKPENFGDRVRNAITKIRAQSNVPILLVQVSPIHKLTEVTDANGQKILDKPIDYSHFHQHAGLSNLVAKLGLMPHTCREHIRLECPRALAPRHELEETVDKFNEELRQVAASAGRTHLVSFDPNIEIEPRDLAADCFHPNSRLQKKFFSRINLEYLLNQ